MIALHTAAKAECILTRYVSAFQVGTALPVTLPPGRYEITNHELIGQDRVYLLNNCYRVEETNLDAASVGEIR